jgi:hypothetical protein
MRKQAKVTSVTARIQKQLPAWFRKSLGCEFPPKEHFGLLARFDYITGARMWIIPAFLMIGVPLTCKLLLTRNMFKFDFMTSLHDEVAKVVLPPSILWSLTAMLAFCVALTAGRKFFLFRGLIITRSLLVMLAILCSIKLVIRDSTYVWNELYVIWELFVLSIPVWPEPLLKWVPKKVSCESDLSEKREGMKNWVCQLFEKQNGLDSLPKMDIFSGDKLRDSADRNICEQIRGSIRTVEAALAPYGDKSPFFGPVFEKETRPYLCQSDSQKQAVATPHQVVRKEFWRIRRTLHV